MKQDIYQAMVFYSPSGYAYHKAVLDRDGNPCDYEILEVNPAFETITGLKAEDIVGKRITQVLPGVRSGTIDWVQFYGDLALNGGVREFTHFWEPLQVWLRVKACSFQKGYFVIYLSNISREVQQIKELDTIFKVVPDGICVLDREGCITKANKALENLVGCSGRKLLGRDFVSFTHEEDRQFTGEILEALGAQDSEANFVNRFLGYDGSYRYIDWQCLTHNHQIYAAARDVTDRMEEQAVTDKLVECSEEFLQVTAADLDYQRIVNYLLDISGADYVRFRLCDEETGQCKTVAAAGKSDGLDTSLFLNQISYCQTRHDGDRTGDARKLLTVYASLNEMSRGIVSEVELEHLEKDYAGGEAVQVRLLVNGNMVGDFALLMPSGKPFKNKGPVEIFTRQVGLLLARTQAEKEVANQKAYFEALFLNTTDAMLYFDEKANIFSINEQFTQLFGYELEEIKGAKVQSIFVPSEREEDALVNKILAGEKVFEETIRYARSGKGIPVYIKGGPVYIGGKIKGGYAVYTDISERKAYEEHLKHLSLHDQLTGLYNRHYYEAEIKVMEKNKRYPISMIVFDVDGLKLVNDTLGHDAGDRLLQLVAKTISGSLRGTDFLARMGGDEFVAVLPETGEETVKKIVNRIRENIDKLNQGERRFPVSVSIGAATAFTPGTSLEEVMKKADERMYHEKLMKRKSTQTEMLAFLFNALKEMKKTD